MDKKPIECWWKQLEKNSATLECGLWWIAYYAPSETNAGKIYWKTASGATDERQQGYVDSIEHARSLIEKLVLDNTGDKYTIIDKKPERTVMDELVEALGGKKQ